jgi:hypothetical protein
MLHWIWPWDFLLCVHRASWISSLVSELYFCAEGSLSNLCPGDWELDSYFFVCYLSQSMVLSSSKSI